MESSEVNDALQCFASGWCDQILKLHLTHHPDLGYSKEGMTLGKAGLWSWGNS